MSPAIGGLVKKYITSITLPLKNGCLVDFPVEMFLLSWSLFGIKRRDKTRTVSRRMEYQSINVIRCFKVSE